MSDKNTFEPSDFNNTIDHFYFILKTDMNDFQTVIEMIKKFNESLSIKHQFCPKLIGLLDHSCRDKSDDLFLYYGAFHKILSGVKNILLNNSSNSFSIDILTEDNKFKSSLMSYDDFLKSYIIPTIEKVDNRKANIDSAYHDEDLVIVWKMHELCQKYLMGIITFNEFQSSIDNFKTLGIRTISYKLRSLINNLCVLVNYIGIKAFNLCLQNILANHEFN